MARIHARRITLKSRIGTTKPKMPKHVASPLNTPLDRSYAQKLRTDRSLTLVSQAKRATFWAKAQRELGAEQTRIAEENASALSYNSPILNEHFASANIHSATLQSAPPSIPSQGPAVAGISESGMIPPPPPPL